MRTAEVNIVVTNLIKVKTTFNTTQADKLNPLITLSRK